jgi:serine acetyltransferase
VTYDHGMGIVEKMVGLRHVRLVREALLLMGVEVHPRTKIGPGLVMHHRGNGVIITPNTAIGSSVAIYQQVTIGRSGIDMTDKEQGFLGIEIGDHAVLCAGAKILGGKGTLRVGTGTVVAANAVLTRSTGDWEVWAGVPAVKVSDRKRRRAPLQSPTPADHDE